MQDTGKIIVKSITTVIGAFCLSLLSFLAVLTWDETDSIAIFFAYMLGFSFIFVVNLIFLKKFYATLTDKDEAIVLLNKVIALDTMAVYQIDGDLNCQKLSAGEDVPALKLKTLLNSLGVLPDQIIEAENYLSGRAITNSSSITVSGNLNNTTCDVIIRVGDDITYLKVVAGPAVNFVPRGSYEGDKYAQSWLDQSWTCFFERSDQATCVINSSNEMVRFNDAFGKEIYFKNPNFIKLFSEKDEDLLNKRIKELLINHQPLVLYSLKVSSADKIFDIHLNYGGGDGLILIKMVDVTLQNSLAHFQKLATVGQLLGSVVHDFNNLLTVISGFCDLLLLKHKAEDPSFMNVMQIKFSADKASDLVKRLLISSRKKSFDPQIIDPVSLFNNLRPLIERLAGPKIKVLLSIKTGIGLIKVDSAEIDHVIFNLIINARQAMSAKGKIAISVRDFTIDDRTKFLGFAAPKKQKDFPLGEYIIVKIKDSGSGIERKAIRKIFEPFYTTKSSAFGTGLGLATVCKTIKQNGAYIFVNSKVGFGTTFTIIFPKVASSKLFISEATIVPKKTNPNSALSGEGTIVLVEDEDAIRMFAKKVLISRGYKVIDFQNARLAYTKIRDSKIKFDLVITDVLMADMNGHELIAKLQKLNLSFKAIFISGYSHKIATEAYNIGKNQNFLAKPFSLMELLAKVKEVLSPQ